MAICKQFDDLISSKSVPTIHISAIFDKTNFLTSMSFEEVPLAFSRKIPKRGRKSQTSNQISKKWLIDFTQKLRIQRRQHYLDQLFFYSIFDSSTFFKKSFLLQEFLNLVILLTMYLFFVLFIQKLQFYYLNKISPHVVTKQVLSIPEKI